MLKYNGSAVRSVLGLVRVSEDVTSLTTDGGGWFCDEDSDRAVLHYYMKQWLDLTAAKPANNEVVNHLMDGHRKIATTSR